MRLVAAVGHRHCAPDQGRPDRHGYCVGCRVDDARLQCASLSFRESDRASLSEADLRTAPVLSQTRAIPVGISSYIKESQSKDARDCLAPMGTTSEAVAEKYGITREDQDAFACASHAKAKAAQDAGYLAEEIAPIKVRKVTPAEGDKAEVVEEVVLSKDEGIRPQTTPESLAKLKPCFKENGTGTAGNSSQISDGASAVTLVRRDVAEKLGLQILAKWVGSAVVGVPPIIMGVGPAYAVPKLFERYGITKDDVDIFELNEAFASQSLMVTRELGLDPKKINPKGGAIALGHPLGATGGRLLSSLIYELIRTDQKVGVATLCMGALPPLSSSCTSSKLIRTLTCRHWRGQGHAHRPRLSVSSLVKRAQSSIVRSSPLCSVSSGRSPLSFRIATCQQSKEPALSRGFGSRSPPSAEMGPCRRRSAGGRKWRHLRLFLPPPPPIVRHAA